MKIRIGNSPALRRLALPQSALRQSALLLKLASPLLLLLTSAEAQVDVLITPPDSDFTIAAPPLCSTSSGELAAATLAAKTVADRHGIGLGKIAAPLRAALAGKTSTPSVFDMMLALGPAETLARLQDQVG